MRKITLITGGAKSGKSKQALHLAQKHERKTFIATAEPFDEEMKQRIQNHRMQREANYHLIEEPLDIGPALNRVPDDTDVAVIDCITVWLGNLFQKRERQNGTFDEVEAFFQATAKPPCNLVLVSNEVGMGLVPDHSSGRMFRDLAGTVNQKFAERADDVYLMVSGIPVPISSFR